MADYLPGNRVQPLIEAAETYPALESAIREARKTVHMAYWTIDPELPVASRDDGADWADLIAETISRGVVVRLLIADFDPVLGRRFHSTAWSSYRRFMSIVDRVGAEAGRNLKIVCSRHEARIGTAVRILGQPIIQSHLRQAVDELNALAETDGAEAMLDRLGAMPGLWRHITVADGKVSVAHPTLPTTYPAAHHEKLCVVDDRLVFLGGLDIDERRYDNIHHDDELPWHDVACRLEGPAAHYFADHFRQRWNNELGDFLDFAAEAEAPEGVSPIRLSDDLQPLNERQIPAGAASGPALVAPLRTLSAQAKSTLSRLPESLITEILEAYLAAIAEARRLIYIETQFLRSERIADALIERAKANAELEIIVILPVVPETALVVGEPDDATKQGQHLQRTLLDRLSNELGPRFGAFTLVRSGPPEPDPVHRVERAERDIVYVHAKVMVVDDDVAIIGSANLNDRSMLTDTETAIAWREPDAVAAFRHRLWRHALGIDESDLSRPFVAEWQAHAEQNARLPADRRTGFVVPMSERLAKTYAEPSIVIPSELV